MPAYVELYMDQGATFNNVIYLTDDITSANINLASYSVISQMRYSYYTSNVTANLSCEVTNPDEGEITMSLDKANTAIIKPGRYVFDMMIAAPSDEGTRVLEGVIIVTPGVSRG